ncbi:hypothetical protein MtrunA17_Chr1g0163471 [Medicago truncatula]|uniref:Uncharacterized protein n=1 Tax=Medicago truncatula TaxID=3880 RepID=A0A396JLK1_MEDTR|nr:hypothetical protein MtrunA17_Chr1g0163471 [Medicago truncatula]
MVTKTYKWWKVPGKLIENIARSLKTIQLIFWGVLGYVFLF